MDDPGPNELFFFKYKPSKKHYELLKQQKEWVSYLRNVSQDLYCYCVCDNKKMTYGRITILRELNFNKLEKTFPKFILYTFQISELIKANDLSEDTELHQLIFFQDLAFKNSIIDTYIDIHIQQNKKSEQYVINRKKSDIEYRIQQLEYELDKLKLEYKKIDKPYTQE